jgi:hypothetical protein
MGVYVGGGTGDDVAVSSESSNCVFSVGFFVWECKQDFTLPVKLSLRFATPLRSGAIHVMGGDDAQKNADSLYLIFGYGT